MKARAALVGRREEVLLEMPSVRRLVDVLGVRCRDISWVRTSVSSLDRFATLTGNSDLEALLARALRDSGEARAALATFAAAIDRATHAQVAALALGPKLWFTLNGVALEWLPQASKSQAPHSLGNASDTERLLLLALVGSGLHRSELLRLRVGDLGSLDHNGELVPDIAAEPLAVRFVQLRGARSFITFLSDQARDALLAELRRRTLSGEQLDASSPLVSTVGPAGARNGSVARASRFNTALIEAGNNVNVELCVVTGRFFRAWGPPGARFVEPRVSNGSAS